MDRADAEKDGEDCKNNRKPRSSRKEHMLMKHRVTMPSGRVRAGGGGERKQRRDREGPLSIVQRPEQTWTWTDEQETWAREKRFFKQKQMSFSVPVIIKRDKYDRIDQWLTVSAEKEQNVCNSCTKSARVKEILPHVRRRAIVMAVSGKKWRACFLCGNVTRDVG